MDIFGGNASHDHFHVVVCCRDNIQAVSVGFCFPLPRLFRFSQVRMFLPASPATPRNSVRFHRLSAGIERLKGGLFHAPLKFGKILVGVVA